MLQSPLDHFALLPFGILANCRVGHELMLVRAIGLDLLSNVFVEMREPFVRHMFDAHDQLLLFQLKAKMQPRLRLLVSSELNPIAVIVFYVAVLRARIPVHAASYIVGIVEFAHFPAHGLAAHILNNDGKRLSPILQEV